MNLCVTDNYNLTNKPPHLFPSLEDLEWYVGYHTYLYILRSIYKQVFLSVRRKEHIKKLKRRFKRLEVELGFPGLLSSVPIQTLWLTLEDLQYFYPICNREIVFPALRSL